MYFEQAVSNGFAALLCLLHMGCAWLYQSHDLHFLRAYEFDSVSFFSTGASGPNKSAMRVNICLFSFII